MIVFDVDGTLVGGESTDWASFRASFEEVAGFALDQPFFDAIEEITAQAIVHQALGSLSPEEKKRKERAVCEGHLRRLRQAYTVDGSCFPAMDGALNLLRDLKDRGVPVALATGDWRETICFKLRAAGIPFEDIPLVTSSEFYSRADIITAAVMKAGRPLLEAVYVGDGLWDLRACAKLGIPFLGVGHRREKLRTAGAAHLLLDLTPAEFWRVKTAVKSRSDVVVS